MLFEPPLGSGFRDQGFRRGVDGLLRLRLGSSFGSAQAFDLGRQQKKHSCAKSRGVRFQYKP